MLTAFAPIAWSATVQQFSPQGSARDVRQVRARFSAPMVTLGDTQAADPFTASCTATGQGRWVDPRNWVYEFEADLPAGSNCRFRRQPGLRTLAGEVITGVADYRFDTGGPAIRASLPAEGSDDIDADQVFIVATDAPVDVASVAANAVCAIANVAERVPVDVLQGEAREAVLAQRRSLGFRYYRLLTTAARRQDASVDALRGAERELTVLKCRRNLPAETGVSLVWGKGIRTASGIAGRADQRLAFQTRAPFTVKVECERVNAEAGCLPMRPVHVLFSAPVPRALSGVSLRDASGKPYASRQQGGEAAKSPQLDELVFDGPFPEQTVLTIELPKDLVDDAGRGAANAARYPLQLRFDEAPPLAKFAGEFGILEAKAGGLLPVTLRNVESPATARRLVGTGIGAKSLRLDDDALVARWLRRVETAMQTKGIWLPAQGDVPERWKEQTGAESVFTAEDAVEQFRLPGSNVEKTFEVIGIPLKKEGFYVIEVASPRLGQALLGEARPRYVATAALVTNLAVHFKWGRESSVAWVTRLDTGKPVANANVRVTGYCKADALWEGGTDRNGIAVIARSLGEPHGASGCNEWSPQPLMISARSSTDFSFTLTAWSSGIAPYDFELPTGYEDGSYLAHTVFDRSLFRAGETVSMKHFFRQKSASGLRVPQERLRPKLAILRHVGSGQQFVLPLVFGADGISVSKWEIPRDARLGEYSVSLTRAQRRAGSATPVDENEVREYSAGMFRVEQFRVPTMKAVVQAPATPLVDAAQASVDLFVGYLAGGGAGNMTVRLRSLVEPRAVSFPGFDDYRFGGEAPRVGVEEPNDGDDAFADYAAGFGASSEGTASAAIQPARTRSLQLDANGAARATLDDLPRDASARSLLVELEYADANGERLTTATRLPLWPANVVVGVATDGWAGTKDALQVRAVVLDLGGKPLADRPVVIDVLQRQTYSYRKRLTGGFYAYESRTEVRRLGAGCSGRSDAQGRLRCSLAPAVTGEVILQARAQDAAGHTSVATTSSWLAGADEWWFSPGNADRMDLLPERKEYQPGETARFQVRMPFRNASALVTIEREGVIESFVRELSGRTPVVEVPVRGGYAPNVFVSVLAVRGRVSTSRFTAAGRAQQPTALVDLARPAFKLGEAQIRVGWDAFRLEVDATTPRQVYKVRDKAPVDIVVRRADGRPLPAATELAVAVVDEGLLELSANPSWSLLDAMMNERALEVWTSTAQMQVVGKRHYGRKAVPAGGGGGRAPARELFDTLLYWNARVPVDAEGHARIDVPLNDSLTAFRVVAIANAGTDSFGTGQVTLRTSQDVMLHAGVPPVVRESDRYAAGFTLRNASERRMTLAVSATVASLVLPPQRVVLEPGASREVTWQVTAPSLEGPVAWQIEAQEEGGSAHDALKFIQQVASAVPLRVVQSTLLQIATPQRVAVALPPGALPGRGGIDIALAPTLAASLAGVRDYMRAYPWSCIEQRLSRAVATGDRGLWDSEAARLSLYLDRDGLLRYFPSEWLQGSDTLTAYVLALSQESGWTLPDASRDRMLAALKRFANGRLARDSALPTADREIRRVAAIEALSRFGAADAALAATLSVDASLWPTSALIDWLGVLQRVPGIQAQKQRLAEVDSALRARLDLSGTALGFASQQRDALWWLMVSGDVNAARLLLAVKDDAGWKEDLPRLLRATLARQRNGHWDTTTANAWGTLAVARFAARFESQKVTGRTQAGIAALTKTVDGGKGSLHFDWPAEAATLSLTQQGTGAPWAVVSATAAVPLRQQRSAGFRVERSIEPVEQRVAGRWSVGDVMRVTLRVDAQAQMSWVVLEDAVPAGASLLGGGLGRDSALLSAGASRSAAAALAFEERRQDAYRAYYRYVPKGTFSIDYTLRLNTAGRYNLPPTHVEAMYAPDMHGDLPVAALDVQVTP